MSSSAFNVLVVPSGSAFLLGGICGILALAVLESLDRAAAGLRQLASKSTDRGAAIVANMACGAPERPAPMLYAGESRSLHAGSARHAKSTIGPVLDESVPWSELATSGLSRGSADRTAASDELGCLALIAAVPPTAGQQELEWSARRWM